MVFSMLHSEEARKRCECLYHITVVIRTRTQTAIRSMQNQTLLLHLPPDIRDRIKKYVLGGKTSTTMTAYSTYWRDSYKLTLS
jgi:hypothetical protein